MSAQIEALPGLRASGYVRHPLHGEDSAWTEKNCYVDLWIELLHTLKLEPLALFASAVAVDFMDDQWTFFKPPLSEVNSLYGIDVQEMTVWRPLLEHAAEHLQAGRLISTEADAFWLPDTAGTDYRTSHSKTTILITSLDAAAQRLGYFHNTGWHELSGEDFQQLAGTGVVGPSGLPFFAELVRIDRLTHLPQAELARRALGLLAHHFERRPASNPVTRFRERITSELPELQRQGLARYHAWAFACTRQAGAAFELAASTLRWLAPYAPQGLQDAAASFETISQGSKALILKGARAVNTGRPLAAADMLQDMENAWIRGMSALGDSLQK